MACYARVDMREDWGRGKEMPVKLILESSCHPLLTTDSSKETGTHFFASCGFQLSIKIVVGLDFDFLLLATERDRPKQWRILVFFTSRKV